MWVGTEIQEGFLEEVMPEMNRLGEPEFQGRRETASEGEGAALQRV